MQFSTLQRIACNPSTLPKIAFVILGRRDSSKDYIFNVTSEQIKKSAT